MIEPARSDVVGDALAAACRDPEVLARVAGPLGVAARTAAQADRRSEVDRAFVRAAQVARTAVPAGLRGVHPSWVEAGLEGLPARARAAVAAGGGNAIDVWLARWATAAIAPMPAATAGRVTSIDSVSRVDAATLVVWLEDAGADQLALALGAAGDGALAAAATLVGDRLTAAAARIALAPRAGALGPARAAIERCRVELDDRALVRIGARAVAPHLDALARLRVAQRLPRALGMVVAADLATAAQVGRDAPRWEALVTRQDLAAR